MEFTLVGIPLIFVLISTFEIARGMWIYHTLAYCVKQGTRYTIVHGSNCAQAPNTCTVSIGQIAGVIKSASLGLDRDQLNLTFTPASGSATTCQLTNCLTSGTVWPPSSANTPGLSVTISATYPFRSMIAMFWPGARGGPTVFSAVTLPASSKDLMQF
jgi:Flp pilus assembly protein TadG